MAPFTEFNQVRDFRINEPSETRDARFASTLVQDLAHRYAWYFNAVTEMHRWLALYPTFMKVEVERRQGRF